MYLLYLETITRQASAELRVCQFIPIRPGANVRGDADTGTCGCSSTTTMYMCLQLISEVP